MAATRFHASQINRLDISKGLAASRGSSCVTVVTLRKSNKVMPSLQRHYSAFLTTMHDSASVLRIGTQTLTGSPLKSRPLHRSTDSQVPYQRLNDCHATSMPDAARPELRFLSGLSRGIVETPVLTSVTVIDTSSMVHLHSSHSFTPDRSIPAFFHDAHHNRSLRMQLRVVWRLHLIGDAEEPTLITVTAWLIVSNYSTFLAHRQLH